MSKTRAPRARSVRAFGFGGGRFVSLPTPSMYLAHTSLSRPFFRKESCQPLRVVSGPDTHSDRLTLARALPLTLCLARPLPTRTRQEPCQTIRATHARFGPRKDRAMSGCVTPQGGRSCPGGLGARDTSAHIRSHNGTVLADTVGTGSARTMPRRLETIDRLSQLRLETNRPPG